MQISRRRVSGRYAMNRKEELLRLKKNGTFRLEDKAELRGIEETEKEFADWLDWYDIQKADKKGELLLNKIKELRGGK